MANANNINFDELLANTNDGTFTVYLNDTVSVFVNTAKASITVTTEKTNAFALDTVDTSFFIGGGMFGRPTIKQGFNKIVKSLN
tara:strand:+ start:78 stop:329 length:252 start_codon:yes stop_codon:yes gene_type:complete